MEINKQSNDQGSIKSLPRPYSMETVDSDTDCIVASLDLECRTNNYKTGIYLAIKQISSITFYKS